MSLTLCLFLGLSLLLPCPVQSQVRTFDLFYYILFVSFCLLEYGYFLKEHGGELMGRSVGELRGVKEGKLWSG